MSIINIPTNYNFLYSVAQWALEKYDDYLTLSNVTIFLPTRRCCREIKRIFLDISPNQLVILPKLKALSDITPEDFLLVSQSNNQIINPLTYQLLLTEEIINWNQKTQLFGKSNIVKFLNIAQKTIFFLECLEKEQTSLEKIYELEDYDLALSKQKIIDFITNFIPFWRNFFAKKGFQTNIASYNSNIKQIISQINQCDFTNNPIIIAGSTGSFAETRNLIAEILKFDNNHLILSGIDQNYLNQQNLKISRSHGQYNFHKLIEKLSVDFKNIYDIKYKQYQQREDNIEKIITNISLPANQTHLWSQISLKIKDNPLSQIQIFEAQNHFDEAKTIAQQIAKTLTTTKKTIALVNNDQNFCQMVKLHLRRQNIIVDDSYNKNIADLNITKYWLLLLEMFNDESCSFNLLNLLKNPMTDFITFEQKQQLIQGLEKILRHTPGRKNISEITILIKQSQQPDLEKSFTLLKQILQPIEQLQQQNEIDIAQILQKSLMVLDNLTTNKNVENLFNFNDFTTQLSQNLTNLTQKIKISYESAGSFFRSLAAINKIDKKVENFHHRVKILSQLEARLLNYDLLIVAGLNEGEFTNGQNQNSWIGQKICRQLGIFDMEQKNGMTFYDFCHYLGNKELILSRSKLKDNLPTIKSNILFRLEIFAKIIGFDLQKLDVVPQAFHIAKKPQDQQYLATPLKHLSITDISNWQRDPYYLYAKRILKLKKLQSIDRHPSFAEFGNFIHKIAEEFRKNFQKQYSFSQNINQIQNFANKYFVEFFFKTENKILWQKKIDCILQYLVKYEMEISNDLLEALTELECNFKIENTNISGKIDRINIFADRIEIIDYKTGTIPQKQEVQIGLEPQLVLSLLAFINQFGAKQHHEKQKSLAYYVLKIKEIKEQKTVKEFFKKDEEITKLEEEAKFGIQSLVKMFDNNQPFCPCPNADIYKKNDYQHLERKIH